MNIDEPLQNLVKPPKVKFANYVSKFSHCLSSFSSFKNKMVSFDKCQLSFTLLKNIRTLKDASTCIIYTHSHGSSGEEGLELLQSCQSTGVSLCYYDSRGCGNSGDAYNTFGKDENIDLLYICFYLVVIYNFDEFILWGRSIGSCAVLQLISNLQNMKLGRANRLDSYEYRRGDTNELGLQRMNSQLPNANTDAHFLESHFVRFLESNNFINEVPRSFKIVGMVLDSAPKSILSAVENFVKVKFLNFKLFTKMAAMYTENWIKKRTGVDITVQQNFQLVRSINVNTIFLVSPKDEMVPYEDSMELIKSFSIKCEQRCYFDVFRMNKGHKEKRDNVVYVNTIDVLLQRKLGKANERYVFELSHFNDTANGLDYSKRISNKNTADFNPSRAEHQEAFNIYKSADLSGGEGSHLANQLDDKYMRKITNAKRWSALKSQQEFIGQSQDTHYRPSIKNPNQLFGSEVFIQQRKGNTPSNANPLHNSMSNSQIMQALMLKSSVLNGSSKKINTSPQKHQIFDDEEKTSPLNDLRLSAISLKKIGLPDEDLAQSKLESTPITNHLIHEQKETVNLTPRTPADLTSVHPSHQAIPQLISNIPETSNSKNMAMKRDFDISDNKIESLNVLLSNQELSNKGTNPTQRYRPNHELYFSTRNLPTFVDQSTHPTENITAQGRLPIKGQAVHQVPTQSLPNRHGSQIQQSMTHLPQTMNGYSTPVTQSQYHNFPSSNGNIHKSDFMHATLEKNRLAKAQASDFFSDKKLNMMPHQFSQTQQWRLVNSGTGPNGPVREVQNPRTSNVLGLKEKILTSHLNYDRYSRLSTQQPQQSRLLLTRPDYRR